MLGRWIDRESKVRWGGGNGRREGKEGKKEKERKRKRVCDVQLLRRQCKQSDDKATRGRRATEVHTNIEGAFEND